MDSPARLDTYFITLVSCQLIY